MSVESFRIRDVGEAQHVQLFQTITSGDVDREQNGPDDETSEEADGDGNPQVAEEEIGIKRMVIQRICIWNPEEGSQPAEQTLW